MNGKDDTRAAVALAARQNGVVALRQLLALGIPAWRVEQWVRAGWLHRVHTGVYAVGHRSLTQRARWLAATLALGDGAVLSHRSAAVLWELLWPHGPMHVTVPTTGGRPHRDGIRVHREALPDDHLGERFGIPVVSLERTIFDVAASEPSWVLERAFDQAQVGHHLSPVALAEAAVVRHGRRGNKQLARLIAEAVEPGLIESHLELRFLRFCRDHGLPRPETQVWFGRWRADFYYPQARLAIETDGLRFHATAARRRRDALKDADLEARGERVLRLRWADVVHDASRTAERLGAALSVVFPAT